MSNQSQSDVKTATDHIIELSERIHELLAELKELAENAPVTSSNCMDSVIKMLDEADDTAHKIEIAARRVGDEK
jgi:hypothetical protein